jgi:hypothetical protein
MTVAILGSVALGLVYLFQRQRPFVAAAADSTLTAARVFAVAARARATAGGADASQLAGGDSIMSAARGMADSGKTAEAAALFTTAAALWDSLPAGGRRAPASRAAAPPPQDPASEASPIPASQPVTDSAAIVEYYRELALGIQARQLGEVRRLLPNLDRFAEDAWRRTFEDEHVEKIEASFIVLNLTRTDDRVHARIQESLVVTRNGRPNPKSRSFFATLTLGPQGWRQIREDK